MPRLPGRDRDRGTVREVQAGAVEATGLGGWSNQKTISSCSGGCEVITASARPGLNSSMTARSSAAWRESFPSNSWMAARSSRM